MHVVDPQCVLPKPTEYPFTQAVYTPLHMLRLDLS